MGSVRDRYEAWVGAGEISRDDGQQAVAIRLDGLQSELEKLATGSRSLTRLFKPASAAPQGLYLYGGVGRGKTMLMDLFFEEVAFEPKTRVHFHAFMASVHERIARGRDTTDGDPIPFVAKEIAAEARLLCVDELHVTDIADAMILGRLFAALFAAGTVIVATSNAKPASLYRNGLNRALFLPVIALIEQYMAVVELSSATDFRLQKIAGTTLYFTPLGHQATTELDALWLRLTGGHPAKPLTLSVKGRKLHVPASSMGVARFSFHDLCEQPLGSNDYLAIARSFHTILIDNIPQLDAGRRNEARRFINLIDTLYDRRVCLIVSAAAEPERLYTAGDGADHFQRTASRLVEMRSEPYLARHSAGRT